jgi:ATP-binding cassette subfamily B protein RaxB
VELTALGSVRLPAILHWDFNHFVVLTACRADTAVVHDPALGRRVITTADLSAHFTGVVLELTPSARFAAQDERVAIRVRDLFRRVVGLGRVVATTIALSVVLEAFQLLMPIGSQLVIDQALVAADIDLVWLIALALALSVLLQAALSAARSWGLMVLNASLSVQWSASLFDHLVRLPLGFFEKRHVGDILSRFGSLDVVRDTFSTRFLSSLVDGVMAIGMLVLMVVFGHWLALVAVGTSLAYLTLRALVYGPYRRATEEEIVRRAREETHFLETLRGALTVKVFGLEQRRGAAWVNLLVERLNARLVVQKLDILYATVHRLLFGLDRVLILALGAGGVIRGELSLGMLVAFLAYKDQFTERTASLVDAAFQLRMLRLQAERIADIALTQPELEEPAPPAAQRSPRALALRGVSFRYGEADKPVLAGLDLEVAAGACLVIVGPSGCGKTTLMKIMAGLLRPDAGEVFVDGVLLGPENLGAFRSNVACVMQDDRLFAGSLLDNITVFDPDTDAERARMCTGLAAIDGDIARMPMGVETLVGDMGSALSGGQRQRLLLARSLYRRPGVLLLDEPTNHLDDVSAARIIDMLGQIPCTRVIVTHDERLMRIAGSVYHLGPAAKT